MHSDDDNDSSMHDSVETEAEAEAEAEGETETEEHEPFEPITDARTLTIDIQQLNAYLTCGLCCGYLREAYTVMECLHSFCHSCLESYFFEYAHVDDIDCPYNNDHSGPLPNAHLPMVYTRRRRSDSGTLIIESPNTTPTKKGPKIKRSGGGRGTPLRSCHTTFQAADPLRISCRYDRILQQFIDKLLVEYATADEQLKRSIMGDSYTRTTSSGSLQRTNSEVEKKKRSMDEALSGTFIIIEVQPDPHSSLAPLSHPIIKLPSRTCIKHLRKYILQQLKMDESTPLDLVYRAQILGSDHSLEFIKRTRWHQQQYHMTICYRPKAI